MQKGKPKEMAVKEENTRITISMPKELLDKIETLASYQKTSKSAVVTSLVQMSIDAQINIWKMMSNKETMEQLIKMMSQFNPEQAELGRQIQSVLNNDGKEAKEAVGIVDEMFEKLK